VVYVLKPTGANRSRVHRTTRGEAIGKFWSDILQRFDCPSCSAIFGLGIVAWPIRQGARIQPAEDSIPTKRQALEIRAQSGGWFLKTKTGGNEPRNVKITQPCECEPNSRFVNPGCPVHGEVRENIPAAPQKTWYGTLPNKPRKKEYDDD
jgi:hypothetical protein